VEGWGEGEAQGVADPPKKIINFSGGTRLIFWRGNATWNRPEAIWGLRSARIRSFPAPSIAMAAVGQRQFWTFLKKSDKMFRKSPNIGPYFAYIYLCISLLFIYWDLTKGYKILSLFKQILINNLPKYAKLRHIWSHCGLLPSSNF
jgi:hypothetical protein